MKLDTQQRKILAANIKGFMAHQNLSLTQAAPLFKTSDNTVWKWRNPTYYAGIQEANVKRLERALGYPLAKLTSDKIKWNGNATAVSRAHRVAAIDRTQDRPAPPARQQPAPGMVKMFTVTLPDGTELSVAKGMKISIISADVVRVASSTH